MGYVLSFLIALGSAWGVSEGGVFSFFGAVLAFGVHPILDYMVGERKPIGLLAKILFHQPTANFLLFFSTPFSILFLGFSFFQFSQHTDTTSIIGNILSTGVLLGVLAINTAHELVHRRKSWQRAFGLTNLTLVNFTWWKIAHVDLHHRHVSTPMDSASSKKNEVVYLFWFRNFFVSIYDSFKFKPQLFVQYFLFNAFFNFCVFYFYGTSVWMYSLVISVVSILMLLTVDYIEHYGLERKLTAAGIFEPVKHEHSWDCYYLLTNFTLFNLGYHAHHHWRAAVPFVQLTTQTNSPKMKYGYSLMMLRSLILKH
jgi:alkane 1-monooxygenase